ncbi:MAG: B12-binding domain-containing protein [Candidatus Bathyarchaeota archaeon]|nr:MAG: B12-binding domain-containing protein [Candidatus Bathyarchaeota archaeon]
MSVRTDILDKLMNAVLQFDEKAAIEAAEEALEAGVDPLEAIDKGLRRGIAVVGEKFEQGEMFLPHLVMAADVMTAASKVLEKGIPKEKLSETQQGIVVVGTVKDDIHDIGKNLVAGLLKANSFQVHDLGRDVPISRFIESAENLNAELIAVSSLMTVTMPGQRQLIEDLKELGIRDKFKVLVGGGPVTEDWAREIGADGYAANASEAVKVAKRLVGRG